MFTLDVMQVQLFFLNLNTLEKASVCVVFQFWSIYEFFVDSLMLLVSLMCAP